MKKAATANPLGALVIGGEGFLRNVGRGISGIVERPVEGAREGGFEGLLLGLVKGALGVVALPVGGIVDAAGALLSSIRNEAVGAEHVVRRLRPPRCLPRDRILRLFSRREAEGALLLQDLLSKDKHFANDEYILHWRIASKKDKKTIKILLITTEHACALHIENLGLHGTRLELIDDLKRIEVTSVRAEGHAAVVFVVRRAGKAADPRRYSLCSTQEQNAAVQVLRHLLHSNTNE